MDTLFGLPAHPFLVHIPVVLLPLAAIGVVLMAVRPAWYRSFRWVVLAIGAVGTLAIVLAASAGEELGARIVGIQGAQAESGWEHHAELGETARNIALVFFVALAAYVLVPWWLDRRRAAARPVAMATATDDGDRLGGGGRRPWRCSGPDHPWRAQPAPRRRRGRGAERHRLRRRCRVRRPHRLDVGLAPGRRRPPRRRLIRGATGARSPVRGTVAAAPATASYTRRSAIRALCPGARRGGRRE